eukprot:1155922-Pelagomonas_calceolata.AAC.5
MSQYLTNSRHKLLGRQQMQDHSLEELCLACATIVFSSGAEVCSVLTWGMKPTVKPFEAQPGCTVASSGRSILLRSRASEWGYKQRDPAVKAAALGKFGACVIDEACQLVEAETAIVIMVGLQLATIGAGGRSSAAAIYSHQQVGSKQGVWPEPIRAPLCWWGASSHGTLVHGMQLGLQPKACQS